MTNNPYFKLKGKLVYDPIRTELRGEAVTFKKGFKLRTLILTFRHDDLSALYRYFVKQKYGVDLHPPMWGNHVTVVRGDEDAHTHAAWSAHSGKEIEVEVCPHVYRLYKYWSLPVISQELVDIRRELCLTRDHFLHVTIGRESTPKLMGWTAKQIRYLEDYRIPAPVKKIPTLKPKARVVIDVPFDHTPQQNTVARRERQDALQLAQLRDELRRIT